MGLAGTWYNEIGSRMDLVVDGNFITGTYKTGVGTAKGEYRLHGAAVPADELSQPVGFAVAWVNEWGSSESVTAWSGQYQVFSGQEEAIIAAWLLTVKTEPAEDWRSTLIGRDIFSRTVPSPAQVAAHARRHPWSHPVAGLPGNRVR